MIRGVLVFRAWRFGESSQHRAIPHSWQVRRCTQLSPVLMHSSHTRRFGFFTDVIAADARDAARFPCGLLVGCVDPHKISLRREVDHHRAKRRPDQRVLVEGSAKGRPELVQALGARHQETKDYLSP